MAIQTRTYFDTSEYTATYDFDDATLRLVAVHVINRLAAPLTIQIVRSVDDVVLDTYTIPGNTTVDQNLTGAQRRTVTLDARGRITNLYARTL